MARKSHRAQRLDSPASQRRRRELLPATSLAESAILRRETSGGHLPPHGPPWHSACAAKPVRRLCEAALVPPLPAQALAEGDSRLERDDFAGREGSLILLRIDLDHALAWVPSAELSDLLGGDGLAQPAKPAVFDTHPIDGSNPEPFDARAVERNDIILFEEPIGLLDPFPPDGLTLWIDSRDSVEGGGADR